MSVLFAHGLEGRPDGRKATALRAAGLDVCAPDGRGLPLAARVAGLEAALEELERPVLVGSSYGGLAALVVAHRHADALTAVLLLAPALHVREPPAVDPDTLVIPPSLPAEVFHGTRDGVVPVQVSRDLARRCPHVVLREVDDDHLLRTSLDAIVARAYGMTRSMR